MLTEEDLQSIKEDRIKYGITDQVLEKNKNVNNTDVNINNTQKTLSERMKEYGLSPETPDTAIETPDIEEDKQGLLNTLSEVYTGVGKSTLSTIKGALTPIIDLPKNIGALFGKSIKGTKDLVPEELTKAQNKNEEIGRAIGEISQFFLMPVAKGAKLADTAPKIQKAANVLLRGLQEAGMVAGLSSLQSEEFGKEQLKEGAIAGAFPIVGAIAKPVLKGLGKSLSKLIGKISKTGDDSIVKLFENPEIIKITRKYNKGTEPLQDDILDIAKKGVKKLVKERSDDYASQLSKIDKGARYTNVLDDIKATTKKVMDDFDIVTGKSGKAKGVVSLADSTIVEGEAVVKKAIEKALSSADDSVKGLDKLKKQLYVFSNQLSGRDKKTAKRAVDEIWSSVRNGLEKNVDGYQTLTSGYREASELLTEIDNVFRLGGKNKETAFNKLVDSFKAGKENRAKLLEYFGGDLSNKITASKFSKVARSGLTGGLFELVGGAQVLKDGVNANDIPLLLAMAIFASPRALGEITSVLGKTTQAIQKASPAIQRSISATAAQVIE